MAIAQTPETYDALRALLDWYVESGVDHALDETPHDRYADSLRTPPASAPVVESTPASRELPATLAPERPAARPRPAPVIAAPDEAARAAAAAAASAHDLADLAARLAEFPHAPFREMAQHFVFSAGTPGARLMVFDAAPGATEETTGEAFSGREAQLLDNMLAAIGHDRTSAYLAYVAPWRPPGDRTPTQQEISVFAPFARRHVELARPEVLLLFGEATARVMLETNEPLGKLRGRPFDLRCGAQTVRSFVFSGLDKILNTATLKPATWRDLRAAAQALRG